MEKIFNDYYLGLDIGTDSLGWAVTDKDYNVLKFNGKAMWGIRLFESGKTAEERRIFRSARRRLQRRKQRIKLLQELFSEEISKNDMGFFLRLEESKYYEEDKTEKNRNNLFNDNEFKDKDYNEKYPTIYHLRKALIEGKEKYDIRLIYLAIHNILKNRGHFLFEGKSMQNISSLEEALTSLVETLKDELDIELEYSDIKEIEEVLKSKKINITNKKNKLKELFYVGKDKQKEAMISTISGATVELKNIFDDKTLDEEEVKKVCFASAKYDEERDKIEDILQERMIIVDKLKAVYDWAILAEIRQGYKYLSFAKVSVYEKHREDLFKLKKVVKEVCPESYKEIFVENNKAKNNYPAYILMTKHNGKKSVVEKGCSQEDLCKFIEKILSQKLNDTEEHKYIKEELINRTLLPKQVSTNNGVIPYQIHLEELEIILENASKNYNFLNEKDESGLSAKEKIIKIMKFRIPYYVGPLNDAHKNIGNAWIVKNSNEKILPWTFDKIVNIDASAEAFIERMTNKCTYLVGADVLAKNSLLYSEFTVLNELNNLKINGEDISVELKKLIFNELFKKNKKITEKKLKSFLESRGILSSADEVTGIDGDFKNSLASYIDFKAIFGNVEDKEKMIEEIIKWIVLFGDEKKILKSRIKKSYENEISEEELKRIMTLKYSGWGRLSKEFLTEISNIDLGTGECLSIITMMRDTNNNLMQLLSNNFSFLDSIKEYNNINGKKIEKLDESLLDDLYASPSVKRSIWQTLNIVREIVKITKTPPKKIFVEMARSEEEKKRTTSRKNKLVELYKKCKEDTKELLAELETKSENDLRSDQLYLYYTQMGKCMYTGEAIELSQLFNKNIYDIDHIYPRSKIKDDSIENRVLVKKSSNAGKSDSYPLSMTIQEKNRGYWTELYRKGFIGKTKYERLTRTTEFTVNELSGFIARQLVETRQSSKIVANVLGQVFDKSDVIYVKAGNVSEFRQKFELIKVRDVNDYHHAKDAYLNIVVGNVYDTKFTKSPANFIGKPNFKYSLRRMYDYSVERNGIIAWEVKDNRSIANVKKYMRKNNILFTRHSFEKTGGFFDQMLKKKGKGQLGIKNGEDTRISDIDKYGGYKNVTRAYFFLVEHIEKKKIVRTIECVPVYLSKNIGEDENKLLEYCVNKLNLVDPKIIIKKIKINTLFDIDGFKMHLSGRTSNQIIFKGAEELVVSYEEELYIKKLSKHIQREAALKKDIEITEYDEITREKNIELYDKFIDKLKNTKYKTRLSAQILTLETKKDKFIELELNKECKVLMNVLNLFKCNSVPSDISLIEGPKSAGIIVLNSNITKLQNIKIINQSCTGLFEQVIELGK